jgi:hypothetical protein
MGNYYTNNIPLPNNKYNNINKINNQNNNQNNNNLSPSFSNYNSTSNKEDSTSNPLSPKINANETRDEVKVFLLKVKEKIPPKDFKEFITDIKLLTDKNNLCNKKEIISHVNAIFQNHRDLYERFEEILLIKK